MKKIRYINIILWCLNYLFLTKLKIKDLAYRKIIHYDVHISIINYYYYNAKNLLVDC